MTKLTEPRKTLCSCLFSFYFLFILKQAVSEPSSSLIMWVEVEQNGAVNNEPLVGGVLVRVCSLT